MPIHNEIFCTYRKQVEEIEKAIRLLVKHNYKVIDLENQLIYKENVNRPKERVKYTNYTSKHNRVYLNKDESKNK